MRRLALFFLLGLFALLGCEKQPSWDVDALVPLVKSNLYLQDLLEDSLKSVDANGALNVVYNSELFSLKVDSLFRIPDTTTEEIFTIPIGNIQLAPGQVFVNDTTISNYDLEDIQLRTAQVRSGEISIELSSSIPEQTIFTYTLPYTSLNGVPFSATEVIPAGSISNPTSITRTYNLSGYELDLRGPQFNSYNTLTAVIQAQIDPNGSVTTVSPGDFVKIENTFTEIIPEYARGFFGNRTENEQNRDSLGLFSNFKSGQLSLADATINFNIVNQAGVDVQLNILDLRAVKNQDSISLNSSITNGAVNLSRAKESGSGYPPITTTSYSRTIDATNSNLPEFLSVLPDLIAYDIDFELNPFGNVSNSNDFIYYNTGFEISADLEIPLTFSSTNLVLLDTAAFEIDEDSKADTEPIQGGNLYVYAKNFYPVGVQIQAYLADSSFQILDSLFAEPQLLQGGLPNENGKVEIPIQSTLTSPLTPSRINNAYDAQLLIIEATLNTVNQPDKVTLFEDYHVAFSVVGDFTYRIEQR